MAEGEDWFNTMGIFEERVNLSLQQIGIDEHEKVTKCLIRGDCEPKF